MSDINILNCSINDLENIYKLDKDIYGKDCYPGFVIRQFYDCFGSNIKIAKRNNLLIGFSINAISNYENAGWILSLAVRKEWRNQGVGSKLLKNGIDDLRNKNIEIVRLTVHPNNSAYKLYKRFGFKDELACNDYYGNNEKRILMILRL